MRLTYYSNVKDGRLQSNVSKSIALELKQFEGKRVEIIIQKLKSTRSTRQNKYWWCIVSILSKEIGYTKDELHEILKFKFLKKEKVDEKTGEIFEYIGSTAKLSKTEFSEIVDGLIQWASECFGISLPMPNEQTEIFNQMRKEDRICLQLADYIYLQYPNIIAHFDVGSGGKTTIGMATRNKRLNKRRGFPDLFIAEPMGVFKGLFIEIKAQSPFKLNGELYAGQHLKEQQDMISSLLLRGYYAEFGVGFDGCKLILDTYLKK